MQHRSSKQWRTRKIVLVYVLMVTAIAITVTFTVLLTLGYRINRDGHVAQGGLVQFGSAPTSAAVHIDGISTGLQTNGQKTLAAGDHSFAYTKPGYREWKKSLDLEAGSILWLNYARLVPKTISPQTVATFDSVDSASSSPDNTKMLVIPQSRTPKLVLETIKSDKVASTDYTLPNDSFTKPTVKKAAQSFVIDDWSYDSRFVLIKHTYDGSKTEWLRIDTNNLTSKKDDVVINVSTQLAVTITELKFRPTNADQLYAISKPDNDLRQIDLDNTTISAPLAKNIERYSIAGDGLLTYVTRADQTAAARTVGYITDGETKSHDLQTFDKADTASLFVTSGVYYNQQYVAITDGTKLTFYTAELPKSSATSSPVHMEAIATETLPFVPHELDIKTHGRFIVAQRGGQYAVYDNELKAFHSSTFALNDAPVSSAKIDWLDGYILGSDAGNVLQLQEFDGKNRQTITSVVPGLDAAFSPNGKYLYAFQKNDNNKLVLVRVQMILN